MGKVIRILLISNFLNILGYSLFAPLYAIFAQRIDNNVFTIATTYGIYTFVTGLSLLFFGRFEDKIHDKKKAVIVGYFILSIGAFSFLLVNNINQLILVQILNAIGTGMVTPAWKALYSKHEDAGREAREWSFYDGGNALIIGIAAIIGGYIIQLYGFSVVIVIFGTVQLIAGIVSLKLLKAK